MVPSAVCVIMAVSLIPVGGMSMATRLAMPKSSTLTTPSSLTMTFSGLMSRWTSPRSCAAASARAVSMSQRSLISRGTLLSPTYVRRVRPEMNSIAM